MSAQDEAERLESQHQVLDLVFDSRLIFPPVTNVRDVLDCGYGAASWAIEVAENYPNSTARLPHLLLMVGAKLSAVRSLESIYPRR